MAGFDAGGGRCCTRPSIGQKDRLSGLAMAGARRYEAERGALDDDVPPLYIEELTKAVLEPGAARSVEEIPATLADSLMAPLDRLSTAKEVAQRAAVLGREFSYPLLVSAAGLEEAVLQRGLQRLAEAEILFVRGAPPSATYTFKHALVQEAAYGSLLRTTRQQLHTRVVDVLLGQFPLKVARLGIARIGLSTVYGNRGEIERGRALAAEVLAAAEARGDAEQALIGHTQLAVPEHYQGKFASSLDHCERTLTLYEPARHHGISSVLSTDNAVGALGYMAWNLWHLGRPDGALARAEESVALARRLRHPFSLAFALFFEAAIHWTRRDHARQAERAEEVIALSEAQGFPLWLGLGRAWHAAARLTAGDFGALDEIAGGLALAGETGSQVGAPALFGLLAEVQHAAGQLVAAQRAVATGLAIAARTGQPFWDAELHRLDGELLLATGGTRDEVAARYRRALAIARAQSSRAFELRTTMSLARLLHDQGRGAAGRDSLAAACARFAEGFVTGDLVEAKALLEALSTSSADHGSSSAGAIT